MQKELTASGPIVSVIDAAAEAAGIARTGEWRSMATLDMRIDYLRAARADRTIHARDTCYHLAFVRCDAHDGDPDDRIST